MRHLFSLLIERKVRSYLHGALESPKKVFVRANYTDYGVILTDNPVIVTPQGVQLRLLEPWLCFCIDTFNLGGFSYYLCSASLQTASWGFLSHTGEDSDH